ncbi:hypothetical protein [Streptomyces sp. NPDC094149]|uniref:hypothetical protein n=1 Tax=Streptomyces sp. NPDC094149 TaxID=3155079 RepID=UPI003330D6EA
MPFPTGTPVVTLVGTLPSAVAGTGYGGQVVLTPSALLTDTARHAVYPGGGKTDIVDGSFSVQVIPNDAAGILPTGWRWYVDVQPSKGKRAAFWCDIHGADGTTIHLDELVPAQAPGGGTTGTPGKSAYEVAVEQGYSGTVTQWLASLVGPAGAPGAPGADGQDGASAYQVAVQAGFVGTESQWLASLVGAKGDKGDQGDPGANGVDGKSAYEIAVQDGFTGTEAEWLASLVGPQGEPGPAGGGAAIRTVQIRVTDDALVDLPNTSTWAVVQTSGGTQLKGTLAAEAGHRLRVEPDFMRAGAHFLDWVILDGSGAIIYYGTTRSSTPSDEGAPSMYPSTSFPGVQGAKQFVVQAGWLNAGAVTIALAHKGTASGKVYAHTTYPFEMLLTNLGPEPA